MLLDSSADGNLLTNLRAGRAGQAELGSISLDTQNLSTGGSGTNVHHQNLVLSQLGNLGLLAIGSLDTKQAAEQEVVDLDLGVDGRQAATVAKDETDQTISTARELVMFKRTEDVSNTYRQRVGSMRVPTPIRPPGVAKRRGLFSANRDSMREKMGRH